MTDRRSFIKNTAASTAAMALSPGFTFAIINRAKPVDDLIIGQGDYRYKVYQDWAKISAVNTPLLNCHEMVMDSKGRLLMIGDHIHNNILVFDKSGTLLDAWGTQYPGGHGLTLAHEGEEDVLFIVDCGYYQSKTGGWNRQAGQVVKTKINGDIIFTIGHPQTIGIYTEEMFFQPTEVAVAPNGDFYVADGYGSDYIIQYNHQGQYIRHFGGKNNVDPNYNLNNAHGVAVDTRDPARPKLIVTSRNDYSFKFFTLEGIYLSTLYLPGAFVCRPVIDDQQLYAGVCWSETEDGKRWHPNTGFVTILGNDHKVLSNPGGRSPSYINNELQPLLQGEGDQKVFNHGHDVCVDEDKNIYVCQWNANKTPPIKLERV